MEGMLMILQALSSRNGYPLTIACLAKARISLTALGALFLKLTPWTYIPNVLA